MLLTSIIILSFFLDPWSPRLLLCCDAHTAKIVTDGLTRPSEDAFHGRLVEKNNHKHPEIYST